MYKSISQKSYADIQISKTLLNKYINNKNYKKYISEGLKLVKGILYVKKQNFDFNIVMSRQKNQKFIKLKKEKFFKTLNLDKKKPTCFIFSHNLLDGNLGGKSILIYNDYLSWLRETLKCLETLDNKVNWILKEDPDVFKNSNFFDKKLVLLPIHQSIKKKHCDYIVELLKKYTL